MNKKDLHTNGWKVSKVRSQNEQFFKQMTSPRVDRTALIGTYSLTFRPFSGPHSNVRTLPQAVSIFRPPGRASGGYGISSSSSGVSILVFGALYMKGFRGTPLAVAIVRRLRKSLAEK